MSDDKRFVLFGAGKIGHKAMEQLGKDRIAFFIDNNPVASEIEGIPVYRFEKDLCIKDRKRIVVTVSKKYEEEILRQLESEGIFDAVLYSELMAELIREKIQRRTDCIALYERAIGWIKTNTVKDKGIICNSGLKKPYPEVSGYYIKTLIEWGYRDLAIQYAKWLCSIQKEDGSWWDTDDTLPYVFDTGQILKGLLAVRKLLPEVDEHILKGCDWLISNIDQEGRFHQALGREWDDKQGWSSELIHLYCLSPLIEASRVFDRREYQEKADLAKAYYITKRREDILDFSLLSHFYAYVMEALLDIGEEELAREAMAKIKHLQKKDGSVPGLKDVNWVCSTGLFQLALVWYRLGDIQSGDSAFSYACKLQNESGGWFGSYVHQDYPEEKPTYFSTSEISWAVKYFLDALYWKNKAMFEVQAPTFQLDYSEDDGRVEFIAGTVKELEDSADRPLKICDAGCGKGAYIKLLSAKNSKNSYHGVDISEKVMSYIDDHIAETKVGNLTNLPFADNELDMTYACEALEHAIDIKSALKEMARVTKPQGVIAIIDKNKDELGRMDIEDWEQWFDVDELQAELMKYCSEVKAQKNISYGGKADNLFFGLAGRVK